ncbi:DMT family transporter [Chloroflexota bacterium]
MAVISAVFFAAQAITARRATVRVADSFIGVIITSFIALLAFAIIIPLMGETKALTTLRWQGYLFLLLAGMSHFVISRNLFYKSIQYTGANVAGVTITTSPIYAVVLAIVIFHEPLTWQLALGASLIVAGCVLVAWAPKMTTTSNSEDKTNSGKVTPEMRKKGILLGLAAGFGFGISTILVKYGLMAGASPIAGTFISYVGACAILGAYLTQRGIRRRLFSMNRVVILYWCLVGIFLVCAHGLRYTALQQGSVSTVAPIIQLNVVFILLFSFAVNRSVESFRWKVIVGAIAVVVGATLLY